MKPTEPPPVWVRYEDARPDIQVAAAQQYRLWLWNSVWPIGDHKEVSYPYMMYQLPRSPGWFWCYIDQAPSREMVEEHERLTQSSNSTAHNPSA